jgi:hypothetical protein
MQSEQEGMSQIVRYRVLGVGRVSQRVNEIAGYKNEGPGSLYASCAPPEFVTCGTIPYPAGR